MALLESMFEPKDILDAENKRAITQEITFMDVLVTQRKRDIRCMDTDLINQKIHIISQVAALSNTKVHQEFIVIGLGKGAIILLHMRQLNKLFLRLTVHKEALLCVKFLTKSALFLSICSENYIKIWKPCRKTLKPELFCDFKLKSEKKLDTIMMMPSVTASAERFLIVLKSGETEIFEYDHQTNSLFWIESEKTKEHECQLSGFDYAPKLQLIVTSDGQGNVRVWDRNKKFLREITFPTPVDSVAFLNAQGDILVAHEQRVSVLKFETYWTKTFDYFNITESKNDPKLEQLAKEDESMFCDPNFKMDS